MTPEELFASPILYIAIGGVILYFIVAKLTGKPPADPSTKPFHGREVRREVMKKETEKRMDALGTRCKIDLEKGIARIGLITELEHDNIVVTKKVVDPKTKAVSLVPDYYQRVDRFKYRKHGFISRLLSMVGVGWKYIVITPDSYTLRREEKFDWLKFEKSSKLIFNIDPTVHIVNDSGVWTIANEKLLDANNEFIYKAHHENLHGTELDFVRRLAVHSVSVASAMEKASHESRLRDEERKKRVAPYS